MAINRPVAFRKVPIIGSAAKRRWEPQIFAVSTDLPLISTCRVAANRELMWEKNWIISTAPSGWDLTFTSPYLENPCLSSNGKEAIYTTWFGMILGNVGYFSMFWVMRELSWVWLFKSNEVVSSGVPRIGIWGLDMLEERVDISFAGVPHVPEEDRAHWNFCVRIQHIKIYRKWWGPLKRFHFSPGCKDTCCSNAGSMKWRKLRREGSIVWPSLNNLIQWPSCLLASAAEKLSPMHVTTVNCIMICIPCGNSRPEHGKHSDWTLSILGMSLRSIGRETVYDNVTNGSGWRRPEYGLISGRSHPE